MYIKKDRVKETTTTGLYVGQCVRRNFRFFVPLRRSEIEKEDESLCNPTTLRDKDAFIFFFSLHFFVHRLLVSLYLLSVVVKQKQPNYCCCRFFVLIRKWLRHCIQTVVGKEISWKIFRSPPSRAPRRVVDAPLYSSHTRYTAPRCASVKRSLFCENVCVCVKASRILCQLFSFIQVRRDHARYHSSVYFRRLDKTKHRLVDTLSHIFELVLAPIVV